VFTTDSRELSTLRSCTQHQAPPQLRLEAAACLFASDTTVDSELFSFMPYSKFLLLMILLQQHMKLRWSSDIPWFPEYILPSQHP
jgi:hypothetical protein